MRYECDHMSDLLSSGQRSFLKGLAHSLQPVVQIGAAGLSEGVIEATDEALKRHELIKVKLARAERAERAADAATLAEASGSQLCQLIGRVAVLYRRRSKEIPGKERIELPNKAKTST